MRLAESRSGGWYDPDAPEDQRNYEYDPSSDGLALVASGDAARTRLAKATPGAIHAVYYSDKWGWKTAGYWVPAAAVSEIEQRLAETAERRQRSRGQGAKTRARQETRYRAEFEATLRRLFPGMPEDTVREIVKHTTPVGAGTVGRTRQLDIEEKARLATIAHIRHNYTDYDEIITAGEDRRDARQEITRQVDAVLARWQRAGSGEERADDDAE